MNVLFAGSSSFSLFSLKACIQQSNVVAVLTRADKPAGRNLVLQSTPVKQYALKEGIPVIDTEVLDASCRDTVARYNPDCMICAAYGKFFGEKFLHLFPKGSVNVHPSLLPRFRGASPILSALIANDDYTGVSLQKIVKEMDAGDILLQSKRKLLDSYEYESLERVLADDAFDLVAQLLSNYNVYYANAKPQSHEQTVCTLKYSSQYGHVSWCERAGHIVRLVRAFSSPFSGVKTQLEGKVLKIWKARELDENVLDECEHIATIQKNTAGAILGIHNKYGIIVSTFHNYIAIEELQLESKRKMHWKDFVQGKRNLIGTILK